MRTTHLLYLHGFRSSPASTKARMTAAAVARQRPELQWLCPQLAPSPAQAIADVQRAIAAWPRDTIALVGSSLGGFYATWLAEQMGCKAVVLNPAVHPARDLALQLGEQTQWHDPQQHFVFDASHIRELRAMEVDRITQPERYFAVIAKGDEVLDWQEMAAHYVPARTKLLPESDHALSDYALHLDEVLQFLEYSRLF
ncbi:MAG: esterase [Burkholderiales bacterium PBB4]|nr:MAG: esterase [Burkholderiales bacterium PBB4]